MRTIARLSTVIAALLLGACGLAKQTAKQFPEGDSAKELEGMGIILSDAPAAQPTRRIMVPGNNAEARGLFLGFGLVQSTVKAGNPVVVQCGVRNTTGNSLGVSYPSVQRFDLVVFRDEAQREPVHVWSEGRSFAQIFEEQMLGPGSTLPRVLEIPTTRTAPPGIEDLDMAQPLSAGTYYVWCRHVGTPSLSTGPVKFEVVE